MSTPNQPQDLPTEQALSSRELFTKPGTSLSAVSHRAKLESYTMIQMNNNNLYLDEDQEDPSQEKYQVTKTITVESV